MTLQMIAIVFLCALITFSLRAFPFVAFSGKRRMPESLEQLGKILPSALMAILIIYCLKDVPSDFSGVGIPKLAAVLCVGITYKWKHNTFFSILLGTAFYMLLIRL